MFKLHSRDTIPEIILIEYLYIVAYNTQMGEHHSSYSHHLEEQLEGVDYVTVFREFVRSIQRIDFPKSHVSGKTCVIGHGPAFPERALICTPQSGFQTLRPEIPQVVCIEPEYSCIEVDFEHTVAHFPPPKSKKRVLSYGTMAQEILPRFGDNVFGTVLMFRVLGIDEQLQGGLMDSIMRTLKPGGHFIGSGDANDGRYVGTEFVLSETNVYSICSQVNMPSHDSSGYVFTRKSIGFNLEKR